MFAYIGLDDTDNLESRGTGNLARMIATELAYSYRVLGVTRHQLWKDEQVPYTKNNSSAAIALELAVGASDDVLAKLFNSVREMMLSDFQAGSDPGLCLAVRVPGPIQVFGRRAQTQLVTQAEAYALAEEHQLRLEGLGGDFQGIVGALAAVGLAAGGEDGRYIHIGRIRELAGWQTVDALLSAGVAAVQTLAGEPVAQGKVLADKLRPARRGGRAVAVVNWQGEYWEPVKLD